MDKRLKEIRKSLNLSQDEFGKRLGVKRSAISLLESGTNKLTEQMIKSICREYRINHYWLIHGKGEMLVGLSDDYLDKLVEEYDLDDIDRQLLKAYTELDAEKRKIVKTFFENAVIKK